MAKTLNRQLGYFVLFNGEDAEATARAFPACLPDGCEGELMPPDDEIINGKRDDTWTVIVRGPWRRWQDGEAVLEPLAEANGGTYDGEENIDIDDLPVIRSS